MMNFLETKTRRKRYEACDELHCVDEKDALPKPQTSGAFAA